MRDNSYLKLIICVLVLGLFSIVFSGNAAGASITIDASNVLKQVDRTENGRISALGTIVLGSPTTNGALYHISGQGVWDVEKYRPEPEVVKHVRDLGISYVRYGMINWTHAVGPVEQRPHIYWSGEYHDPGGSQIRNHAITYGLPEALHFTDGVGSIPIFVLPMYSDNYNFTLEDAADMMKYLYASCDVPGCNTEINNDDDYNVICIDSNVYDNGNSVNWPQVRVCDKYALGRTDLDSPWDVTWFEFSNETLGCPYTSKQEIDDCIISFSNDYNSYRNAMQGINPNIKLGAPIVDSTWYLAMGLYQGMVQGTGDIADFYIPHIYIPWCKEPAYNCSLDELIEFGLAGTNGQLNNHIKSLNSLISEMNDGINVPLAVTEYDAWFYMTSLHYSLGHALATAEYIRQFMHADHIALGTGNNFTQLLNTHGQLATEGPFTVRPKYYTFQLYNHFFGDILLYPDVNIDTYEIIESKYNVEIAEGTHQDEVLYDDALEGMQWIIDNPQPTGSSASQENGILTIDFNGMNDEYLHSYIDATIDPGELYRLSGFMKTDNITSDEGVYLAVQSGDDLVTNAGFEDPVLNSWGAMEDTPVSLDLNTVHSGGQSLRMDLYTEDDCSYWSKGVEQTDIAVSPDTTYTFEGYIKTEDIVFCNHPSAWGMRLDLRDAANNLIDWTPTLGEGNTDWTYLSIEFTTGSDTTSVTLQIYGTKMESGTVWLDDVKLANKSTAQDVYGASSFNGTEGTDYSWSYVTADFMSPPDIPANARVFVGRRYDGTPVSGTAMFKDVKLRKYITENHGDVPYLSVNASKSEDGKKLYLMVVNKDLGYGIDTTISLENFNPVSAKKWTLSGPNANSTNEDGDNVNVVFEDIGAFSDGDIVTFPKHSLTALVMSSAITPDGWYDADWEHRQKVIISKTMTDTDLPDFPVLIKITDQGNPVFNEAQVDADDVVFTLADGVIKLDHEIEHYQDTGTKEMVAWVRIPQLSSTEDTMIYMYYGNRETFSLANPSGVWINDFTMIQHLEETRKGQGHNDSTSHDNSYQTVRVTRQGDVTIGKIGGADEFDGVDDKVVYGQRLTNLLNVIDDTGTMSAWLKPTGSPVSKSIIYYLPPALGDNWGSTGISRGEYDSDGDTILEDKIWVFNGGCAVGVYYQMDEWVHITWRRTADTLFIYKNGVEAGSKPCTANLDGFLNIGHSFNSDVEGGFFAGLIDEVRVSNTARSAEWIDAEYNNQNDPENYIGFATPETLCTDNDGDGYAVEGGACGQVDCDDNDASVNPGAIELCYDGIDNDCDGFIDAFDDCVPPVTVALVPGSTTVTRGGTLAYTATATNNTSTSQTFQYWTYVILPDGNRHPATGELIGPVDIELSAGQSQTYELTQYIPEPAPTGVYTFFGNMGLYPELWDSESFQFTVQ